MKSRYTQRKELDERLVVRVPEDMKRELFAVAAKRGRQASDLAREAIASICRSAA